jgi:NAD(P)-dependent dehydrogenase (short-subunit alcohol dehydrogenase family)/acyl carrier protein
VDLPGPRAVENPSEDVVGRILSEFSAANPNDVLAYRGKHRWKRKYEQIKLTDSSGSNTSNRGGSKRLRDRGVYLITGGTGGLGLAFARYLAKTCRARIVLTKKTEFPKKSTWAELARSDTAPEAIIKIVRELLEIERLGAEVEVFVAEAADPVQMRRVVDETLSRFQAINGVFHAAGIVRAGLIQAKKKDMAEAVMSPKVQGTWILHDLLARVDVDFLVLFSSITSVIAPYAEADYVAANSFLDAFASYSNAHGRVHTLVINWPGWKEAGQLADLKSQPGTQWWKEQALAKAIATKDGMEAFSRAFDSDLKQVIVSPENIDTLIEETREGIDLSNFSLGSAISGNATFSNRDLSGEGDQPSNAVEAGVARIWKGVFGHDQIGVKQQFAALGGHSLIAMQIVAKVRSFYQIDLSLRDFFDGPTIAQLSSRIELKIMQEIEALSDEEAGQLVKKINADEIS